jgi:hypothetical protein
MTDPALANAEKRRDALAAEINQTAQHLDHLRRRKAAVDSFIAEWHAFAAGSEDTWPDPDQDSEKGTTSYPQGSMPLGGPPTLDSPPLVKAQPKNSDKADVGREAKTFIYERARPVPRSDLYKELIKRGLVINGKDPEMVLSTMMWRMKDDFVRLPGHGYWIKKLPWKPAKYEPGTPPQQDIEDVEIELNALQSEDDDSDDVVTFHGYQLRPAKTENGWIVVISRGDEPPARTKEFSSQGLALEEAKTLVQPNQSFRRL